MYQPQDRANNPTRPIGPDQPSDIIKPLEAPDAIVATTATGPANDATYGVVIGAGTNAVAMTDTKLQTQIIEGTGTDQVLHGATQISAVQAVGDSTPRYVNIVRTLQNNSAAPLDVEEAGLYALMATTVGSRFFCIARDLISFSIGVGQVGVVQYQLVFNLT